MNRRVMSRVKAIAAAAAILAAIAMPASSALAANYVIGQMGNPVQGWFVGYDPRNTGSVTATFENGPATPPMGTGSLEVHVIGDRYSKVLISRADYTGRLLTDFTALSYWNYFDSASTTSAKAWYYNLYIDIDNDGDNDIRADFAPDRGLTTNTWQFFDMMIDAHWRYKDPASINNLSNRTFTQLKTDYPGARVSPMAMVFNMGDSARNYNGTVANIDAITIGTNTGSDTWDFEVGAANLSAAKSNSVGGATTIGAPFDWVIDITNNGTADAIFDPGEAVLIDYLPDTGLTYSAVNATGGTATGTVSCTISATTFILTCDAGSTLTIPANGGTLQLTIEDITPTTDGSYSNPRDGDGAPYCAVDPDSSIPESSEGDNDCGPDTVVVSENACALVANCSFEAPASANAFPDTWKRAGLKVNVDGTDTGMVNTGAQSMRFTNTNAKAKRLFQDITFSAPQGTQFELTFAWRGENVSGNPGFFRVMTVLYYTGGTGKFYVNMPTGSHGWETYTLPFTAAKTVRKIRIEIDFGKRGTAWFDSFGLTVTPP